MLFFTDQIHPRLACLLQNWESCTSNLHLCLKCIEFSGSTCGLEIFSENSGNSAPSLQSKMIGIPNCIWCCALKKPQDYQADTVVPFSKTLNPPCSIMGWIGGPCTLTPTSTGEICKENNFIVSICVCLLLSVLLYFFLQCDSDVSAVVDNPTKTCEI